MSSSRQPGASSEPGLAAHLALLPELAERYDELLAKLGQPGGAPPVLLELCRLRIAQLMGCNAALDERSPAAVAAGLDEEAVKALAQWPTSPHFDAAARAALAFTECYVIDAHAVTDEQCAELRRHLSDPEVSALSTGIALFDAITRMRLALAT